LHTQPGVPPGCLSSQLKWNATCSLLAIPSLRGNVHYRPVELPFLRCDVIAGAPHMDDSHTGEIIDGVPQLDGTRAIVPYGIAVMMKHQSPARIDRNGIRLLGADNRSGLPRRDTSQECCRQNQDRRAVQ
jgi:hypothetical protein